MNAREIMKPDPLTVRPSATVSEVGRLMVERGINGLPVVDDAGGLLGLITERDLVMKHARVHVPTYLGILGGILPISSPENDEELRRILAVTARDLMEEDPITATPDASVDDIATLMVEEQADPIPIMEEDRVVGIVGHTEIIRLLLIEEGDGEPDSG